MTRISSQSLGATSRLERIEERDMKRSSVTLLKTLPLLLIPTAPIMAADDIVLERVNASRNVSGCWPTYMSGESIWAKWNIRRELFPEIHFENTGNLAFSYVIAPFEGLIYTGFFAMAYYPIRRLARFHSMNEPARKT